MAIVRENIKDILQFLGQEPRAHSFELFEEPILDGPISVWFSND
jgi:hypothetical protein